MENKTQNNPDHFDEITFNELKSFFKSLSNSVGLCFYKIVRFIIKNAVYLILLITLGFGLGYFLDRTSMGAVGEKTFDLTNSDKTKTYEVVVVPNYGSIDFVTDWINHYEDKEPLTEGIKEIKIQGVENIYDLMDENEMNFHTLSVLNSKLQRYQELLYNSATNKKYRYQKISFVVLESFDFNTFFKSFQKQVSEESYYQSRKNIELERLIFRKEELLKSLNQINSILDKGETAQSDDLANLVTEKDNLLKVLAEVELKILEGEEVLFEVYRFETKESEIVKEKSAKRRVSRLGKEVKLPVLFVFLFVIGNLGLRTYKKYSTLNKQ